VATITLFANDAPKDSIFPNQSKDYDDIMIHFELNGDYLPSMTIFDEAWQNYIDKFSEK
jgi:uncharacterized protein YozE (UPF0346 family)